MSTVPVYARARRTEFTPAESVSVVTVGHVDHGKSTIVGRLLADSGALPQGKLDSIRGYCERNSKPFEFAFLLDSLKDEQSQGITIDAARIFFRADKRNYMLIDAPGHVEFLKNMVTGAARADAALLVIDALEGIRENSLRHGYLLSFLGVKQIVVLVNKMDLVNYSQSKFESIVKEYGEFLAPLGIKPMSYIPVSGTLGENVAHRSTRMNWYGGPTVSGALELFRPVELPVAQPFRMPVQGVYKFTGMGDDRRIIAGSIDSGSFGVGDTVVFYPSGKRSVVKSIENFNAPISVRAQVGQATGFTVHEQVYVARGEIVTRLDQKVPQVASLLRVRLFWLGREPLQQGIEYGFRLGTASSTVQVEEISRVLDAALPGPPRTAKWIERNQVAECTLRISRPIAFDVPADVPALCRFVLIHHHEIHGGGVVVESIASEAIAPAAAPTAAESGWRRRVW